MNKKTAKLLWKLFPNTTYQIWKKAHDKGVEHGRGAERKQVQRRLMQNHVKDFGKPSLTLGYEHAYRAAMDTIEEA